MTTLPDGVPSRLPDWLERLTAYISDCRQKPFRPGQHDCALFAAGAVEAMTGMDPAASWRGTYRTIADGKAALQSAGYSDHVAAVASLFEEVPPSMAHVGDLAVVDSGADFDALGVVQGAHVFVLVPAGLWFVDRMDAKRAFRV